MRRALAIDEKSLRPGPPGRRDPPQQPGVLLQATNRMAEAEPLYAPRPGDRRAVVRPRPAPRSQAPQQPGRPAQGHQPHGRGRAALCAAHWRSTRDRYGPDHPDVAINLNNLAGCCQATNRMAEAEPLFRRALAIDERSYGPDHPDIATTSTTWRSLLQATNRLAEAEPLSRRALAIDERSYGPDHPDVATHLNNLAELLRDTNRVTEAEPLYAPRSGDRREGRTARTTPRSQGTSTAWRRCCEATNRTAEAEPLYAPALAIDEQSYGPDHPNVAIRLNNLAQLLQATNRMAEAEPLLPPR